MWWPIQALRLSVSLRHPFGVLKEGVLTDEHFEIQMCPNTGVMRLRPAATNNDPRYAQWPRKRWIMLSPMIWTAAG